MNESSIAFRGIPSPAVLRWQTGLLVAAFLFAISTTIPVMVQVWSRPDYSHGFLVPAISLFFIWRMRHKLREIPIAPSFMTGLPVLLMGTAGLLLGSIGGVAIVQLFATVLIIPGVVLLVLGKNYLKALFLPIAYLFLVVPALDLVLDKISLPLQIFDARSVEAVLGFCRVPVFRTGTYLELPNHTLEIAPECSGLGFLISFLAIGIPVALFTQRDMLRRALVVLYAVLCCVAANLLRITLIGLWTYHGGEFIHGPGHIFVGVFISYVGFFVFFAGVWAFPKQARDGENEPGPDKGGRFQIPHAAKFNGAWAASLVLLSGLGFYLHTYEPTAVPVPSGFGGTPAVVGVWSEQEGGEVGDAPFRAPRADAEIVRNYIDGKGKNIRLYMAYFTTQTQGKEFIYYTLQPLYDHTREITLRAVDSQVAVNEAVIPAGPEKSDVVFYLHIVDGKAIANRYRAKFATALNGILAKRTDGVLIIASMDGVPSDDVEEESRLVGNFVAAAFPEIIKTIGPGPRT